MRLLQKFAERHARRVAPPNKFAAEGLLQRRPKRDPEVRALCEKFTPHAIATLAEIMGDKKAQPSARVAAAMAILKKTLPDLASVEHTGDGPRPFAVIPEVIETAAEWRPSSSPRLSISNLSAT